MDVVPAVVQITLLLCGYVVQITTKGYYSLNSDGLPQLWATFNCYF